MIIILQVELYYIFDIRLQDGSGVGWPEMALRVAVQDHLSTVRETLKKCVCCQNCLAAAPVPTTTEEKNYF